MRRKRMRSGRPRSLRSGVIERVITTKRSVQSPVAWVINSIGFAVRPLWKARHRREAMGRRQIKETAALLHLLVKKAFIADRRASVILLQVEPVVKAGDLITVAVVHQCIAF